MKKEPTYQELRKKGIRLIKRESKKYGKDFICTAYMPWIELFQITPDEIEYVEERKDVTDE